MGKRGGGNKPKARKRANEDTPTRGSKTVWGHDFSRFWASRQEVFERITEAVRDPTVALDLYLDASRSDVFRSGRLHEDFKTGVITVELLDRSAWDQVPFGNDVSVTILGDHEGIFTWRQDLDRWYPTAGQRERGTLASFLPPLVDPRPTTFRRAPTTMPEPQQADSLASQPLGESGESTEVPKPPRKPGGPTTRSEGQEDSFPRKIPS